MKNKPTCGARNKTKDTNTIKVLSMSNGLPTITLKHKYNTRYSANRSSTTIKLKPSPESQRKNDNKQYDNKNTKYVEKNLCVVCGIDIGHCNPRQLCGKTYCMYGEDYLSRPAPIQRLDILDSSDIFSSDEFSDESSNEDSGMFVETTILKH